MITLFELIDEERKSLNKERREVLRDTRRNSRKCEELQKDNFFTEEKISENYC